MKSLLFIILQCYFSLFPSEAEDALKFVRDNARPIKQFTAGLSPSDRIVALSVVAPEISQYSRVLDFVELRTLFISYRNFGKGDFSVGYFQMKPSFIESLENEIINNKQLKKKYASYIPEGDLKEKRTTRLKRLSSLEWSLKYLEVFIEVAKNKTASISFRNIEDKVKYWATLYNSGFKSSPQRVAEMQKKKYFPHSSKKFNYADVALEFYKEFQKKKLLSALPAFYNKRPLAAFF